MRRYANGSFGYNFVCSRLLTVDEIKTLEILKNKPYKLRYLNQETIQVSGEIQELVARNKAMAFHLGQQANNWNKG